MKTTRLLLVLAIAATLGGCVVAPAPDYAYAGPTMGPPAPLNEVMGVPPYADALWIGGFWDWAGNTYNWRPGHWESRRPGYHWVPHRWDHAGNRWHHGGGNWEMER